MTGRAARSMIDPQTRDVIQDEHAEEVIKKPDGKLGVKVLETFPQVKDECKVLKMGRCALVAGCGRYCTFLAFANAIASGIRDLHRRD